MSSTTLEQFVETYQSLSKNNLDSLRAVYSDDIQFVDNLHHLNGFEALLNYFESQYSNLSHCKFQILEAHQSGDDAWITWEMDFAHPRLNRGQSIIVPGASHLRINTLVYYHRDYFDMGQVLYENLPVIGPAIRWIKRKAAQ